MSRRMILILLVCLLGLTGIPALYGQTLQEAISAGQVNALFFGTGSSSGDSVMVDVSRGPNAKSGPLRVSVPPGSFLDSSDGGAQSMMVLGVAGRSTGGGSYTPTSNIQVPESGTATYVLTAFCAEFHKENPSSSTHFTLREPRSKLSCIAQESSKRNLSIEATQAAVWIYTDRLTFSEMNEKFSISRQDWDRAQEIVAACASQ